MRKFWTDCVLATIFVFVTLGLIVKITDLKIFSAFDPLGQALGDMELTDIAFSQLRSDPTIDTNIVMVNIGDLSRREIAMQLEILNKYQPKVIGIDSFFDCARGLRDTVNCPALKDVIGNIMLGNAIEAASNIVMVTRVAQTDSMVNADIYDQYDSMERTDSDIRRDAHEGFANLDTDADNQESFKACRSFNPKMDVAGETKYAFSVQMAMLYDSAKAQKFLRRGNPLEIINYRGNIMDIHGASNFAGRYYTLDWDQVLNEEFFPPLIRGKVVIMGYLGSYLGDTSWEDKFFTPLNKQYAGKANPDMYGPVIHANIISMILSEDYVEELAKWQEWAIAITLCFLNVALFSLIHHRIPDWFDGITILLQLLQIVLLSFLMINVFDWMSFKLNLTMSLAALALVGTCFEIYVGVVVKGFDKVKSMRLFTKKKAEVLTSD
jgi:CHASE2 domain-containing sensor protein